MCGIAGAFGPSKSNVWSKSQIQHLKLRGPDSQKFIEIDSDCHMIACRLAMTDPQPRSNQPFRDAISGNILTFNGEIYNFREIRAELIEKFPREPFLTDSDTEVLLRLLDKFGEAGLPKLQGMYAFAYYRLSEHQIWLGRDFLGKKPLYWTKINGTLYWSSSQESFRSLKRPEINQNSLIQFLSLGYLIDPNTTDSNTKALMPGTVSIFSDSSNVILDRTIKIESNIDTRNQDLRQLISSATERRLEGHEKVALSLSGGVDSSIIALQVAKYQSRIKSFTSIWSDSDKTRYNVDAKVARKIAKELDIKHEEVEMPAPKEIPNFLDNFLRAMEEPNGNPTGISLYRLYQAISQQGFRLVLTGDGSDEIFGGYQRYKDLAKVPNVPILNKARLVRNLVEFHGSKRRQISKFTLALINHSRPESWLYWHLVFARNEIETLLQNKDLMSVYQESLINPLMNFTEIQETNPINSLMHRDHRVWLDMESNRKLDRVSMHFSIEARSPFQDERIIDWAMRRRHVNNLESGEKTALRLAYPELKKLGVREDKAGFISPVGHWLRLNPDLVSSSIGFLRRKNDLSSTYLSYLQSTPEKGDYRGIKQLWHLIVWSRWNQIHNE